jgi:hypothetical protein
LLDQYDIGQQGRTAELATDFLGRTTHVDINDLCAKADVMAGRLCQFAGFAAYNLHGQRCGFAIKITTPCGFAGMSELRVRGDHFGNHVTGAQFAAKLAERSVGYTCHRSQCNGVRQFVGSDLHGRIFACY